MSSSASRTADAENDVEAAVALATLVSDVAANADEPERERLAVMADRSWLLLAGLLAPAAAMLRW